MIDRVGEHIVIPNLSEFIISLISLFSHTPKTTILLRDQTGKSMATYSATHWWSRWEVIEQVSVQFGNVLPFLHMEGLGSATTTTKLITFFTDYQKKALLEVELATIIEWGRSFVTATYSLEGDGPLALECYEKIEPSNLQYVLHILQILMLLHARYLPVLKEAYCRGPFLLIFEDQHPLVRHYSKGLFSMVLPVCSLAWIVSKSTSRYTFSI